MHCCPADLAAHCTHFRELFLGPQVPQLDLQGLPAASHVSRSELANVVASLYSRRLALSTYSVEPILRLAVAWGCACVREACVAFITTHIVPVSPAEVCRPCSTW